MTDAPALTSLGESRVADPALADGGDAQRPAASGHQIQVMDLGFALQAHSLRALALDPSRFVAGYNAVPTEIDDAVAREALRTLSTVQLD